MQAGMTVPPACPPPGSVAVLFISRRAAGADDDGYAAAAAAMSALAGEQPGYLGETSVRGADGTGVTISWWADQASAAAWRDQADHAAIRGRARGAGGAPWYDHYVVAVCDVARSYAWTAPR
jgi:heme-degrading monooxygenase HmoA